MKTFNQILGSSVLALGLILVSTVSCVNAIPNHPGSVNKVDNALYDGILTTRAGIESAKVQFQGVAPVVNLLNTKVIPPFNKLEAGYAAYHTALVTGKGDPAQLTELQAELSAVTAALAEALKTGAANPAPVK